jgi:replicative DNA helicase
VRYGNKQFAVEVAGNKDIKDVPKVLYGLQSLSGDNTGIVFFVEGEKDVDTLIGLGLSAVTTLVPGEEWHGSYNEQLGDRQVIAIGDNDEPGKAFAWKAARSCGGVYGEVADLAALVGKKDLPKGYDLSDVIGDGLGKQQLYDFIDNYLSIYNDDGTLNQLHEDVMIALLVSNHDLISEASVLLLREDFTYPANRLIYETILRQPLDWSGLRSKLTSLPNPPLDHLDRLEALPVSTKHFHDYYEVIREHSTKRALRNLSGDIAYRVEEVETEVLLADVEKTVTNLSLRGYDSDDDIADAVRNTIKDLDHRISHQGELLGYSTALPELDIMTSGLQRKDLVIVAGRPSMGKTSFVTNLVERLVIQDDKKVLFFSLEMSKEQLIMRMLSSMADVDASKLRTGTISSSELDRIHAKATEITKSGLLIDDQAGIDIRHIISKARRLARKTPIDMIVVDYLQLIRSLKRQSNVNRDQEVSQISSSLKSLAKELDVPVVALAQLNRGVEMRENKRPNSSDLRESGSIEQDADLILMLYRDSVYNKNTEVPDGAEIIITKQRNGPVGTVKVRFNASRTRFEPYQSAVEEELNKTLPSMNVNMEDLI